MKGEVSPMPESSHAIGQPRQNLCMCMYMYVRACVRACVCMRCKISCLSQDTGEYQMLRTALSRVTQCTGCVSTNIRSPDTGTHVG